VDSSVEHHALTRICDGTSQTLANFHGVVNYCVIKNGKTSRNVIVSVKGFRNTLLAPGYAIVCRTSLVKVRGLAGSVVTIEFVGPPDLALGI